MKQASKNLRGDCRILALLLLVPLSACVTVSTGHYPPFIKAAQSGDIAEADRLLRNGALVNQKTIGNQTALHVAAAEGQEQMVLWLLSHEADPLATDLNGKTPGDFARAQGKTRTEELIRNQLSLYEQENAAGKAGDWVSVKELLSQDSRRYTLLHVFAQMGDIENVKHEIDSGSNVNARTTLEMSPLHKSIVGGSAEIQQRLLKAGAEVNAVDFCNNTPLYYASFYGNTELVSLLLVSGADKQLRSVFRNETPLDLAKRMEKPEVIKLLEEQ